jgi:hypothetical protein
MHLKIYIFSLQKISMKICTNFAYNKIRIRAICNFESESRRYEKLNGFLQNCSKARIIVNITCSSETWQSWWCKIHILYLVYSHRKLFLSLRFSWWTLPQYCLSAGGSLHHKIIQFKISGIFYNVFNYFIPTSNLLNNTLSGTDTNNIIKWPLQCSSVRVQIR